MKISVIMPCHNGGPWIADALASIAQQTSPPHEVIVIDDASSDDSAAIAERSDVVTQVVRVNLRNAAAARNAGIVRASGEWIAFLDADDQWHPGHLKSASDMLRGSEDVAYLAHNDQIRYEADGSSRRIERDTHPPVREPTVGLTHEVYFEWFARTAWFFPGSLVANREAFLTVGGFDPTQVRRHDFEMFFRLIHGRTWTYNPAPGAIYRFMINPQSISANNLETSYFTLRALIKNEFLYAGPAMDALMERWARRALRLSVATSDHELRRKVWRLASPRVSAVTRSMYWGLNRSPWVGQTVRRGVQGIRAIRLSGERVPADAAKPC